MIEPGRLLDTMTEERFTDALVGLFRAYRWRVTHFRPAQTSKGWRTPIQGDRGFPDLVAVRRRDGAADLVILELKSKRGRLSDAQHGWIDDLAALSGVRDSYLVAVARPAEYPRLEILARFGVAEYRKRLNL